MLCSEKQCKLGEFHRLKIDQDRIGLLLASVAESLAVVDTVAWYAK
jgi:hypothetical protein